MRIDQITTAGGGSASGWQTWRNSGDPRVHWSAYGPKGTRQGSEDTDEAALTAAREAERELTR